MTIDCCTWMETNGAGGDSFSERRPAAGEGASVDAAMLLGCRSRHLGVVGGGVDEVARRAAASNGRLIGVAGIDPPDSGVLDDLERAVEMGCRGVCVSPADQNCRPTSDRFLEVAEWCAGRGLAMWIQNPRLHEPASVLEFACPMLLDEAARTILRLRLVLGDLGVMHLDEAMCMLGKHARVFAETSAIVVHARRAQRVLIEAMERGVMHKLLFGSGSPRVAPEAAIERLYGAASFTAGPLSGGSGGVAVPREQVRAIVERDALELLDINIVPMGGASASVEHAAMAAPAPIHGGTRA